MGEADLKISEPKIDRLFDTLWPDFEKSVAAALDSAASLLAADAIPNSPTPAQQPILMEHLSDRQLLAEIARRLRLRLLPQIDFH